MLLVYRCIPFILERDFNDRTLWIGAIKKIKGNIRNRNVHDARIGHTRAELHDVGMSRHVENNDLRRTSAIRTFSCHSR